MPSKQVFDNADGAVYTTSHGAPVSEPYEAQHFHHIDLLAHFDRERIPERVVHAKGAGAHGYFEVTHDISDICYAALFKEIGKRAPATVRFSTVGGESGSADTARDPRGFAIKLRTEEGNWDWVFNNTPVFFIRDPTKFPHFIHTQKRDPQTNLKDADMFWDYLSQNPESIHQVMILFGDRGIPDGYRHQHGYSGHTFKWYNANGDFHYVQVHAIKRGGFKFLTQEKAVELAGSNPDYGTQDLFEAIENGEPQIWDVSIQTMTPEEAENFRYNVLDLTKIWPHKQFPLRPIGKLVLDRNPENYFNEIEQVAFSPSHMVPGVEATADPVLQSRLFSYPDTHRHRLGPNYQQLPVNAPLCPVANFQRGGFMNFISQGARPNYQSSIQPLKYKKSKLTEKHESFVGAAVYDLSEITELDFEQPRALWQKVMSKDAQERFVHNVAGHLGGAKSAEIKARQLSVFAAVDQGLSDRIAKAMGVAPVKPLQVKPAGEAVRFQAACTRGPVAINKAQETSRPVSRRHRAREMARNGIDWVKRTLGSPSSSSSSLPSPRSEGLIAPIDARPTSPASTNIDRLTDSVSTRHFAPDPNMTEQLIDREPPASGAKTSSTDYGTLGKPQIMSAKSWPMLESALRALEGNTGAFPPLRSALRGIIHTLDITAAANRDDYEELASDFKTMADTLNRYVGQLDAEGGESVANILQSIEAQVAHIDKKRGGSKTKRILESTEDKEDVIECYRKIAALFQRLQCDISLRTLRDMTNQSAAIDKQFMTALLGHLSQVDDARYNSSYSMTVKRRGCTPETREVIQQGLQDWVQDPQAAKVYWMDGMAGTGKTTIAYSLCEWLEGNKQLGGSFFCSRTSAPCSSLNRVVPTIAYQLARYSPAFRSVVCKVHEDPDIGSLNVVQQFEKLIRKPLSEVNRAIPEGVVVVIDALDECQDSHGVRLVVELLLRCATELPIKFFVTSRPEHAVRDKMLSEGKYPPSVLHLHDIEQSIVEEDIKKFLAESLNSMSSPPASDQIDLLAKRAGKLFIYAATVARFVLPDNASGNPKARLSMMLDTDRNIHNRGGHRKVYKELDTLYSTILLAAFHDGLLEEETEAMRRVLWTVVCEKEPMTIQTLASLLDLTEDDTSSALRPLRSVLHVSESGGPVSTLHASFPDYMLDQLRSSQFYLDEEEHSQFLAERCFKIMKVQLRFNICKLETSFVFDRGVPNLEERVQEMVSPALFYVCRYWGEHLRKATFSDILEAQLVDFLARKLLFWMEVLNLGHCITMGPETLQHAKDWLYDKNASTDSQDQAADARDFVTEFATNPCSLSTPHIYISALPFCPKSSCVYENFWKNTRMLADVNRTAINADKQTAKIFWKTDIPARAISCSPDGTHIAVGSCDGSVHARSIHTGVVTAGPFKAHTVCVYSVAFSHDNTRIASGGEDHTIRVWNVHTGEVVAMTLLESQGLAHSLAFSPDGTRIISSSGVFTIQVWDATTGKLASGPFQGHTSVVPSVAFSPDNIHMVSGSYDKTVCIWNSLTGSLLAGPLQAHTGAVLYVSFSPDGARIVSGSDDGTLRIWDSHTGELVGNPFQANAGRVTSAVFSSGGNCIVSSSITFSYSLNTIHIWDVHTGDIVAGPFRTTSYITSATLSPDGTRIFSASSYGIWSWPVLVSNNIAFQGHMSPVQLVAFTSNGAHITSIFRHVIMQVRDAHTGEPITGPISCPKSTTAAALSPDGTCIVCDPTDYTTGVLSVCIGDSFVELLQTHIGPILSMALSPDSSRVVLGSHDGNIWVYDAHTGDTVIGPLQGHRNYIASITFSSDGTRIASGSGDVTVRVWGTRSEDVIAEPLLGHTGYVSSVAFSPDDTRIASGSMDRTIRVWSVRTGCTVVGPLTGHDERVLSIAFSPDGTRIVSSSLDPTIRVWDAHTGNLIGMPFYGHAGFIRSVAFSPDGTRIVSGSDDSTIRVWVSTIPAASVPDRPAQSRDSIEQPNLCNAPSSTMTARIQSSRNQDTNVLTGRWTFNNDGWVTNEDTLLFWVAPSFHTSLPVPDNSLVISPLGSTHIDYRNLALGRRWSECYISE
ncbi:Vegetative incompatibility protein HET-E-1 [Ceratobasidium theobromae]|uniref:Catalase n=1 Tax=Ceratobasidium theobromae TaxID=1582974 RepID=A0A5N5QLP0_9AGAM|nr:Vegetative incompatibility protein HET-E-1 [Ceratobasidium theobromae]